MKNKEPFWGDCAICDKHYNKREGGLDKEGRMICIDCVNNIKENEN